MMNGPAWPATGALAPTARQRPPTSVATHKVTPNAPLAGHVPLGHHAGLASGFAGCPTVHPAEGHAPAGPPLIRRDDRGRIVATPGNIPYETVPWLENPHHIAPDAGAPALRFTSHLSGIATCLDGRG